MAKEKTGDWNPEDFKWCDGGKARPAEDYNWRRTRDGALVKLPPRDRYSIHGGNQGGTDFWTRTDCENDWHWFHQFESKCPECGEQCTSEETRRDRDAKLAAKLAAERAKQEDLKRQVLGPWPEEWPLQPHGQSKNNSQQ